MNIYSRFKLYTCAVVLIGAAFVMRGIYDFLNLQNWALHGYPSRNAMANVAFWMIFSGVIFTAYFIWYLKIQKKQTADSELIDLLRKKENHFLLGISGGVIACLISVFML